MNCELHRETFSKRNLFISSVVTSPNNIPHYIQFQTLVFSNLSSYDSDI